MDLSRKVRGRRGARVEGIGGLGGVQAPASPGKSGEVWESPGKSGMVLAFQRGLLSEKGTKANAQVPTKSGEVWNVTTGSPERVSGKSGGKSGEVRENLEIFAIRGSPEWGRRWIPNDVCRCLVA
eukprot:gene5127-biopygen10477